MIPELFGVPWTALEFAEIEAFLSTAGEEGITWEAKADRVGKPLHPGSVSKAACGLANQVGGYILLGASWDKQAKQWHMPGFTAPDPEPELWIGKAIRSLNPAPRHRVKSWPVEREEGGAGGSGSGAAEADRDDGGLARIFAVVQVEPVVRPPCMTRDGRIYERVSGETIPVTDPVVLDRLQQRGQAALDVAVKRAERAALRARDLPRWADQRSVGVGLGIAPLARESDDIGARLFTKPFRDKLAAAAGQLLGRRRGDDFEIRQEQDAVSGIADLRARHQLHPGGAATRQYRSSWLVQGSWDGAAAAAASFSSEALIEMTVIDDFVVPAWTEACELVRGLGGYGAAQLVLAVWVYQADPPLPGEEPIVDQIRRPPPHHLLELLPQETFIGRQITLGIPSPDEIGSVHRELQRAAGQASYETPLGSSKGGNETPA